MKIVNLIGAMTVAMGISVFAQAVSTPPPTEYKTTAENDHVWMPEDTQTPIIPNGTANTRICKYRSARNLCYRLILNDSTPGGIPIPYDTEENFQTLLDLLDREPDKSYCEISPEIWSPWQPQGTVPTECGTHTYTEESTCSQLPNTCPGACPANPRTRQQTVTNGPCQPAPTVRLSANPINIQAGETTRLSWSSTNADSCQGNFDQARTTLGSRRYRLQYTGTVRFTYTCTNSAGSDTASVLINVGQADAPSVTVSANPSTVNVGQNFVASWNSQNTRSCTSSDIPGVRNVSGSTTMSFNQRGTYTLEVTCEGYGGRASGSTQVRVNVAASPPTVDLTVPNAVTEGVNFNARWTSTNATSCTSTNIPGVAAANGTRGMSLSPGDRTYRLNVTCSGPGGNASDYADIRVLSTGGGDSGNGGLVWLANGRARCESTPFPLASDLGHAELAGKSCTVEGATTGRSSPEYCQWFPGQPEKRNTLRYTCRRR